MFVRGAVASPRSTKYNLLSAIAQACCHGYRTAKYIIICTLDNALRIILTEALGWSLLTIFRNAIYRLLIFCPFISQVQNPILPQEWVDITAMEEKRAYTHFLRHPSEKIASGREFRFEKVSIRGYENDAESCSGCDSLSHIGIFGEGRHLHALIGAPLDD